MGETKNIILAGNPNSGKSTLFNVLTGLKQQTGNFPGVTVSQKTGSFVFENTTFKVTDLPGTYSLYAKSLDETVSCNYILSLTKNDILVYVADASNLKRSLYLFTQIQDLGIPCILALNMMDIVKSRNWIIDVNALSKTLNCKVIELNAKYKEGIQDVKEILFSNPNDLINNQPFYAGEYKTDFIDATKTFTNCKNPYQAFLTLCNQKEKYQDLYNPNNSEIKQYQRTETFKRYQKLNNVTDKVIDTSKQKQGLTEKLDNIFTHKIFGYLIFLAILLLIFQSIFSWATIPMDFIDAQFGNLSSWLANNLPSGILKDLLIDGIVAGLSGIVIFVPQIAILFAFIAILEESGYMARVSFIMDRIMRKFGLNGTSVIPLISGTACAVPAIMSARTIKNWKERLITIFVTPFISCSARLPVYTILIALVIPEKSYGFVNLQGLTLMGLYLLGFVAAIGTAAVMKFLIKSTEKSYFIMELPAYRLPRLQDILLTIVDKVKIFLWDAGKIIIAISIVLWVLCSYGPTKDFEAIETKYENVKDSENLLASEKLEASYAGILGKSIEPVISPLGYDWKMGIALITSFAAREVFVGTLATLYSVGNEDEGPILEKMRSDTNEKGEPVYNFAVGLSLMLFYAFAMQCMSTIAIMKREANSWKWAIIQLVYMTGLAYISALVAYQLLK